LEKIMLDYNLEYLRAFYYAAKLKSLTKAAEILFVSQPAVSQSISKLETHLGAKLFERSSRGTTLTSEGIALYQHVAAAMERLILGEQELSHMIEHSAGTLHIAATETPLYRLLLPKAREFQKQHPQIFISISGGGSVNEAFAQLTSGQVDIAMGVSPLSDNSGLEIIEGTSFSDIAVASSEFSTLKDQVISAGELCEYPVISTKRGTNARLNLDLWFAEQGILFEPNYSV
jgi:DNA-binding transcriptional LysR family regulator